MFGTNRSSRALFFLLLGLCGIGIVIGSPEYHAQQEKGHQPIGRFADDQKPHNPNPHTIPALLDALDVLQAEYFEIWQGIWPRSIDWTSAVIGTYLAAALSTLSTSFASLSSPKAGENIINKYFSQLVASYFGQDAFSLRQEAYDDMLWVVLGWLEGIKFINTHSETHYSAPKSAQDWYGTQWIPAFAHRARLFWELASQGWDTSLCNGGMIWSPYLTPYKNAITNELYISASISMYLYFPGDSNTSPFRLSDPNGFSSALKMAMEQEAPAHDPKYLAAAIEAYKWLVYSNMTDSKGLYVDGYHISGWSRNHSQNDTNNTRCDARNEMVYTYNQGVLLTGQRGLYEATGAKSYLEDGHKLISDVIAATGWDLKHNRVPDEDNGQDENQLGKWHGLGRSGILEELCDAGAYCSQDSQTFKGIFFHHLTTFCQPLLEHLTLPRNEYQILGFPSDVSQVRKWHANNCLKYNSWIKHNARGALTTRDGEGRFGMWWGAPENAEQISIVEVVLPDKAVDYRNEGIPGDWKEKGRSKKRVKGGDLEKEGSGVGASDLNDRGRGRTVETQGGGVSVLRALWELVDTKS